MSKYEVSPPGVAALNALAASIGNAVSMASETSAKMRGEISSNPEGAGPHFDEILETVTTAENLVKKMEEPAKEMIKAVTNLAEQYEVVIARSLSKK